MTPSASPRGLHTWPSRDRIRLLRTILLKNKEGRGEDEAHLSDHDIQHATDVSGVDRLPAKGLPKEIRPVTEKLFMDLLDPKLKLTAT
jgi:hypothetical protein